MNEPAQGLTLHRRLLSVLLCFSHYTIVLHTIEYTCIGVMRTNLVEQFNCSSTEEIQYFADNDNLPIIVVILHI